MLNQLHKFDIILTYILNMNFSIIFSSSRSSCRSFKFS